MLCIPRELLPPSPHQVTELEQRIKTITDHYTSQIETLSSERSTLKLLLEDEQGRLCALREKSPSIDLEEGLSAVLEGTTSGKLKRRNWGKDPEEGGREVTVPLFRRGQIQSPAVAQAVGFLDSFGAYVGLVLRRNPGARLVFAVYVLLLHLWVMVVLYHSHHQAVGHAVNLDPPGANAMQG